MCIRDRSWRDVSAIVFGGAGSIAGHAAAVTAALGNTIRWWAPGIMPRCMAPGAFGCYTFFLILQWEKFPGVYILKALPVYDIISVYRLDVYKRQVQNSENLVSLYTVYLCAFRTVSEYQGKGYFSKLFQYMIDDLRKRGFRRATLGVETDERKNREIYRHYGFTQYIKQAAEVYPDGSMIQVDYYAKNL